MRRAREGRGSPLTLGEKYEERDSSPVVALSPFPEMNKAFPRNLTLAAVLIGSALAVAGADDASPLPRPRLTETLRAKAEAISQEGQSSGTVTMDKVVVKEARLPTGPPKEEQTEGRFSITEGGYLLKNRGEKFSTEVGLWRHIDIMEEPTVELRQSTRIRMGFLKVSW